MSLKSYWGQTGRENRRKIWFLTTFEVHNLPSTLNLGFGILVLPNRRKYIISLEDTLSRDLGGVDLAIFWEAWFWGVTVENAQNVRGVKILRHRTGLLLRKLPNYIMIEANARFFQKQTKKIASAVLCQQQNVKLGPGGTYQLFLLPGM